MKKKIFSLMLCAVMFDIGPLFAMEKGLDEDSPWHITIAKKISDAWDSVTGAHKCSVCREEIWFIHPDRKSVNGDFTPVSDDVIRRIIIELTPKEIFLLPTISKKMCNILNFPTFWKAMEKQNKVHVSKELCPKQICLENYKYFCKHSSGLFEWGEGITCSVKNPIFFSFIGTPYESTWNIPIMISRGGENEAKFYSFSIEQRQFELYILHPKGNMPKWMREAKENREGETKFTSVASKWFQAGSDTFPTCFVRELKSSAK